MRPSEPPESQPLFRAITAGDDTTTLGLRSLRWTAPTALIAALVLAVGAVAGSVSYAKRQQTIGFLAPAAGALRVAPPRERVSGRAATPRW